MYVGAIKYCGTSSPLSSPNPASRLIAAIHGGLALSRRTILGRHPCDASCRDRKRTSLPGSSARHVPSSGHVGQDCVIYVRQIMTPQVIVNDTTNSLIYHRIGFGNTRFVPLRQSRFRTYDSGQTNKTRVASNVQLNRLDNIVYSLRFRETNDIDCQENQKHLNYKSVLLSKCRLSHVHL